MHLSRPLCIQSCHFATLLQVMDSLTKLQNPLVKLLRYISNTVEPLYSETKRTVLVVCIEKCIYIEFLRH